MSNLLQISQINRKHIIGALNHLPLGPVGLCMLDRNLTNFDTNFFPHVPDNSVIDCKLPHPWVSSSGQLISRPPGLWNG